MSLFMHEHANEEMRVAKPYHFYHFDCLFGLAISLFLTSNEMGNNGNIRHLHL